MTDSQKLLELAERCEKADGPSRVLDFEIQIAAVEDKVWPTMDRHGRIINPDARMSDYLDAFRSVIDSDDQDFDFPRFTASLDAALTLVPEGWRADMQRQPSGGGYACVWGKAGNRSLLAATPALALCGAALRARAAI